MTRGRREGRTDRIAVVTGAARGIGLAIARKLLEDGLVVVGVDADQDTLARTADTLSTEGLPFHSLVADLSDPGEVARVFERIDAERGGLDALVNNAGTCFVTDFVDIAPDEFRRQMAINFDSAFYCCQQAIPRLLERRAAHGRVQKIVNISSNGAYNFDVFDPAHYRASKAAMDTLTKHLARRYAREGIAVNSLAPAMTRTDLFDVVEPEVLERAIAAMPRGEPMRPAEIAAWASFLISPAGDGSSGNVILLNQGRDVR